MRMIFFGASALGYECCHALLRNGEEVVGIVSIPREFEISYSKQPVTNVTFRSFEDLGKEYNIPVVYVERNMSGAKWRELFERWRPTFGLAIGWYYMIPASIRSLFPQGIAGVHASMLPKYRGGAPLVWAMIEGVDRTGVSLFYLESGVDTGDVIAQAEFEVLKSDTISDVLRKATEASVGLVTEYVPRIAEKTAPRVPQDSSAATVYPQRNPADGLIAWHRLGAEQVYNWVRAQTKPYPGAYTLLKGERLTIWDVALSDSNAVAGRPGAVVRTPRDSPAVICADQKLVELREVERVGASTSIRIMQLEDVAHLFRIGDVFEG